MNCGSLCQIEIVGSCTKTSCTSWRNERKLAELLHSLTRVKRGKISLHCLLQVTWQAVTEVRSESALGWLQSAVTKTDVICCETFSSSSVVSRTFSALCLCSTFGHHPHPLGYFCAKFHFFAATIADLAREERCVSSHSLSQLIWCSGNRSFCFGISACHDGDVCICDALVNIEQQWSKNVK